MNFKVGDYVTRTSYDNDIIFVITDIKDNIAILKGCDVRLVANSPLSDLNIVSDRNDDFFDEVIGEEVLENDRCDYFYLPAKILHLDADKDYLKKCLDYYKKNKIMAYGYVVKEDEIESCVKEYLKKIKPDILIITGHDAYFKKNGDKNDLNNYKNSKNFVRGVQEARRYENSHEKLLIISGACQSNYEELIKAGADFASSPKRVNIHALDPAIIATYVALSEKNKEIDLISLLEKTKYGKDGIGGLKVNGFMYVGYPR